jgi:uncharacterized membrane protein
MSDEKNNSNDDNADHSAHAPLIQPKKPNLWVGLRSSFLAGVVIAAPVGITIALVYWFVTGPMAKLDAFVKTTLPDGGSTIETFLQVLPGFGLLIAFVALVLLGAVTKNFVGRSIVAGWERLFESLPVVRNLFKFFKNVFETALQQSDRSFKEVALIEYPRRGSWAMGFLVGETKGEVANILDDQGGDLTAVFVPTVPNPTSGFLLFVPREDLRVLTMSVEDAAKMIFSMGLVAPEFSSPEEARRKLENIAAMPQRTTLRSRLFRSGKSKATG